MTDTAEIKTALEALVAGMLAKGLRQPNAEYSIRANSEGGLYVNYRTAQMNPNDSPKYEFFHGATFERKLKLATDWVGKLPSIEQRQFREFAEILAKAVEVGKQNGIDAVLVNPLEQAMKKLSKNALMFQPEAA